MLLLGIITFCIAIPLCSNTVNAFHYTRLAVIIFIMSGLLTIEIINIGVEEISIYCSLVFQSNRTLFMEVLLFMVGGLCLITFHPKSNNKNSSITSITSQPHQYEEGTGWRDGSQSTMPKEYSLVVIFSVIGASIILSSYNLISIYLATELQSFALYIIAALSRDSLRSVQASLKYFILGA
ncbi:MAG: hypothetical protein EOP34_05500 [Rickettsiales bacterium]|jgi:NADH-ubiquinone oxidoreductase chain 2|nr:MAG: hypothetical protein EOP34_05500 [Rickettsiales bacterium]